MTDTLNNPSHDVVAVIPAYNEGERVKTVVEQTLKHVSRVIVVDDGSEDDTIRFAESAGALVVPHPYNLGKGAACRTGFYAAMRLGCQAIIMLDGDGQHAPEEIPLFIEAMKREDSPGIYVGNRMHDTHDMPLSRYLTNRFLSSLISFLARQKVRDSQCGFRLIHREVLEKVHYENNRYDAESEILVRAARAGFAIREVNVSTIYGDEFSKINPFHDTIRFLRFFFRHLFFSPPVIIGPEHSIAVNAAEDLREDGLTPKT